MSNGTDRPSDPQRTDVPPADSQSSNAATEGPLSQAPLPGGVEAEGESEMRPEEHQHPARHGAAEPRAPESDRERHHRQSD